MVPIFCSIVRYLAATIGMHNLIVGAWLEFFCAPAQLKTLHQLDVFISHWLVPIGLLDELDFFNELYSVCAVLTFKILLICMRSMIFDVI